MKQNYYSIYGKTGFLCCIFLVTKRIKIWEVYLKDLLLNWKIGYMKQNFLNDTLF